MRFSSLVASLPLMLAMSSASAVTMDWTPIGNPGNACDPQPQAWPDGCFGAVDHPYSIGTYEVTNAQYAEFLNAKAASDPLALYSTRMATVVPGAPGTGYGGITRSGASGSYTYSVIAGREDMPVNHVAWFDIVRFANWMNNGQGAGDTETGAYTLLGGTPRPSNWSVVTRNASATIFIPSEDEWYKAAFYSAATTSYFDYPTSSNTPTACSSSPSTALNTARCYDGVAIGDLVPVGSYPGSTSPYGTFDQGGNIWEWNETIIDTIDGLRGARGGSFDSTAGAFSALVLRTLGYSDPGGGERYNYGFRVAMLPEPDQDLLRVSGVLGLLGLAGWRRVVA